ncbi:MULTISPECIES: EAL domain-containing protein [Spirulina sp. CCY15215]|uniref:EAL domain-containing protein n=1 Tax=Spirulina sp. CCY15215 TaxID=2767591 RepID=UPI001950954C|nr:EAL domain-containing protein [Spirulina major]
MKSIDKATQPFIPTFFSQGSPPKEREASFALALFQSLPVPVMVARLRDGIIIHTNEYFCSIFGSTVSEVIGHHCVHDYFEAAAWQVLQQALVQYDFLPNYELKLRRVDGKTLWGVVSLQLLSFEGEGSIVGVFHDITYPKKIEYLLHENRRNFSTLTDNLPGVIYRRLCDRLNNPYEFISEGCWALTGYTSEEFTQQIIDIDRLIHADDRDRVLKTREGAIKCRQPYTLEYRIITRSHTQKWVREKGNGILDRQGELIALEGFLNDISDRKRGEEELQLLQYLTRAAGEAPDLNSALELVLNRACQVLGWDFGEAWIPNESETVLELSPAWYGDRSLPNILEFREQSHVYYFPCSVGLPGRIWQSRQPQWFPDLSRHSEFLRSQLAWESSLKTAFGVPIIADDKVVAVLVFFSYRDRQIDRRLLDLISTIAAQLGGIIQCKQAEVALRDSQRQLRSLIDSTPGIFFNATNDAGWSMNYLSEGCQTLTGYRSEELIAKNPHSFEEIIDREDVSHVLEAIAGSVKNYKPYVVEYRIHTKYGECKWVWEKGRGIYDEAGNVLGLEGFITDITERKQAEQALRSQALELQALFAAMTDIIIVFDAEGRYLKIAPTNPTLLYKPSRHLIGKNLHQVFDRQQAELFLGYIQQALKEKKPINIEYNLIIQEQEIWFAATIAATEENTVIFVARDITEAKGDREALKQAEAKYRSIFENAVEGIFQTTPDGHYISANPALAKIYGYSTPEALIISLTDIEHQLYVEPSQRTEFARLIQQNDEVVGFESQIYRQDGSIIWISENARVVRDEQDQILYYEGMVVDITEQKQDKEELHQRAFYDALTNLPNRALFRKRLSNALERGRQNSFEKSYHFAVLFLDLDRFKVVNDSLGHLVGDRLLIEIARRLEKCVRQGDTVARLGGDEFTILLDNIEGINTAIHVAERIEKELQLPFQLDGYTVFTGVSIGIVSCGDSLCAVSIEKAEEKQQGVLCKHQQGDLVEACIYYQNPEDLLRDADTALYRAKELGKGRYELFNPAMHQSVVSQWQWETELRQALEAKQFAVHYHPIVCLQTGTLQGFEVLLRWQHPEKGMIYPAEFLDTAEESGLIIPIGNWVLETACKQIQSWQKKGKISTPLDIHVNLSSKQLLQPDLIDRIDRICTQTGFNASWLKLEIAESLWTQKVDAARSILQSLQERNIQLCIDDFGTGYSRLEYLQQFPIHGLKIERSFVSAIEHDAQKAEIARIIVMLAKNLGLRAIAEGIETQRQLEKMREFGCDLAQGYFFAKVLDAREAEEFLTRNEPLF